MTKRLIACQEEREEIKAVEEEIKAVETVFDLSMEKSENILF